MRARQRKLNRSTTYGGFYHALSVAAYAEETFAEALEWIEEHNSQRAPHEKLTVSRGILRLVELGLEGEG